MAGNDNSKASTAEKNNNLSRLNNGAGDSSATEVEFEGTRIRRNNYKLSKKEVRQIKKALKNKSFETLLEVKKTNLIAQKEHLRYDSLFTDTANKKYDEVYKKSRRKKLREWLFKIDNKSIEALHKQIKINLHEQVAFAFLYKS